MKKSIGVILSLLLISTTIAGASPGTVDNISGRVNFDLDKDVPANQQRPKKQTAGSLDQIPSECEGAAARLDFAVIETKKLEGNYLIIIARLGTGEVSGRLNLIRLAVAEEYVLRRGSDLKYVLAQGDRVKGLGRLELYVGGRLADILPLKRNAKGYCFQ